MIKCDYVGCKNPAKYEQKTISQFGNNKPRIQITHICENHANNNDRNMTTTHGKIFNIPFTTTHKLIE